MFHIFVAAPRGFCAGVARAVEIVQKTLEIYGPPVYIRKQIVHNSHVVSSLRDRGAVFVDEVDGIPSRGVVIFSAHGVAPQVRAAAQKRGLIVIDAACPLVMKVHHEAIRYAREGRTVLLIGDPSHDEVRGVLGEAPDNVVVIRSIEDARTVQVKNPNRVAMITQTTLSLDDVRELQRVLLVRFPDLTTPAREDVCYATQNRQSAVRALACMAQVVFVLGSKNSSNSIRLQEVAIQAGARAHLVESSAVFRDEWLAGVAAVVVTAGASTPEDQVEEFVHILRARGGVVAPTTEDSQENVSFPLPSALVQLVRMTHAA